MLRPSRYRLLHWLFEASLAIKGLLTSAEAMAGLGLLLTPNRLVARFGDSASVASGPAQDGGWRTVIRLPMVTGGD